MANARNPKRKGLDASRDPGGFIGLPWSVVDCPNYARLSSHAKALLIEVARQFVRDNNGRLLLSGAHMAKRGWRSNDRLTKAKNELLEGGFIFQTVMGHRPNKASWFAVTWRALDKLKGFDAGAEQLFRRGAYQQTMPLKNARLTPPVGVERPAIAPPVGVERLSTTPPVGAIRPVFATLSTPPVGDHLDMPSVTAFEHGNYKRLTAKPIGLFTSLLH